MRITLTYKNFTRPQRPRNVLLFLVRFYGGQVSCTRGVARANLTWLSNASDRIIRCCCIGTHELFIQSHSNIFSLNICKVFTICTYEILLRYMCSSYLFRCWDSSSYPRFWDAILEIDFITVVIIKLFKWHFMYFYRQRYCWWSLKIIFRVQFLCTDNFLNINTYWIKHFFKKLSLKETVNFTYVNWN